MRPFVLSILAAIALYNLHQLAGLFDLAPNNVLSKSSEGEVWTFVIDKAQMGTADLQRMGINLAFAQMILVAGWFYVPRAKFAGVLFALWFVWQAVQIWATCNCSSAEHIDWIVLAVILTAVYLWGRWTPTQWAQGLKVVWNKFAP